MVSRADRSRRTALPSTPNSAATCLRRHASPHWQDSAPRATRVRVRARSSVPECGRDTDTAAKTGERGEQAGCWAFV